MSRLATWVCSPLPWELGVGSAQNVLINGAGATFPYPMYSKWFDEYHKKFPTLQFNYQSIGSGGGIQQVTQGTVDFGATDGPMNDMQLKDVQESTASGVLHFPTVMGADVPVYNIPGVSAQLNFTGDALAGIFLGQDHQVERSGDRGRESGRKASGQRYRRRSPLRWQRHDVHFRRLSVQSQQGMGNEGRSRHVGELAGGSGWQGQRRRFRSGQADAEFDWLRRADLCPPEQDVASAK